MHGLLNGGGRRWWAGVLAAAVMGALLVAAVLVLRHAEPARASGRTVSAVDAGAAGDGRTDDTIALQQALDGLRPSDVLVLPAGRTFAHADVLRIRTAGVTVTGGGTLLATDEERAAVQVAADGVTVTELVVDTARTSRRWAAPEQTGLWLDGHRDAVVRDVTVVGAASAGVFVQGSHEFRLTRVTVRGSRADGIHLTGGARHGVVEEALTQDTGDDGVAVVSYRGDREQAGWIQVLAPRVHGSRARGLAVVGGRNVTFSDVDVRDTAAAGVYVACERGQFDTRVPSDVTVEGGVLVRTNQDAGTDHGALLVYNGQGAEPLRNVSLAALTITDTRSTASRQVGLVAEDDGPVLGVELVGLAFTGTGPPVLLGSNTRHLDYRVAGWSLQGHTLPDGSVGRQPR